MIDVQKVAAFTKSMLDERFSGYVLVGFVAGCDAPVQISNCDQSEVKRLALIASLQEAEMILSEAGKE